jgi:hypothetical protein
MTYNGKKINEYNLTFYLTHFANSIHLDIENGTFKWKFKILLLYYTLYFYIEKGHKKWYITTHHSNLNNFVIIKDTLYDLLKKCSLVKHVGNEKYMRNFKLLCMQKYCVDKFNIHKPVLKMMICKYMFN